MTIINHDMMVDRIKDDIASGARVKNAMDDVRMTVYNDTSSGYLAMVNRDVLGGWIEEDDKQHKHDRKLYKLTNKAKAIIRKELIMELKSTSSKLLGHNIRQPRPTKRRDNR